jgi:hypothetical protein
MVSNVSFRILSIGLAICSLGSVGWFSYLGFQSGFSLVNVQWLPFIGSIALQLMALYLMPFLWERLLGFFWMKGGGQQKGTDRFSLYKAFSRSWLARYIPGRIWMFGGRMLLTKKLGISAEATGQSMFYEFVFSYSMLTMAGAALIISVLVHPLAGVLVFIIGTALIATGIPLAQKVLSQGKRVGSQKALWQVFHRFIHRMLVGNQRLPLRLSLWGVTMYGIHVSLQLMFIVLVAESFLDLSFSQAAIVAGVWALSGVLGYLSFLSPAGGLGVRDGLALVFLSQVLDASASGLIIAAARIVMIPADLAFVGSVELLSSIHSIKGKFPSQQKKLSLTRSAS